MTPKICFFLEFIGSLCLAPLLPGIINRVKAIVAGRHGKPILQTYYDICLLLKKSEVRGQCAGWVFITTPAIVVVMIMAALILLPTGGIISPLGFCGDFLLAAYFLAMSRFALTLGALDTGSPFEGMGASREATFGAIAEPALFMGFLILTSVCMDPGKLSADSLSDSLTLGAMLDGKVVRSWEFARPEVLLTPIIFFILLLAENCRIPVDDPTTHLELTMIHEAMILDYSGPNLAFILYASSLKLWFFAALIAGLLVPDLGLFPSFMIWLAVIITIAILVGLVESSMARLRLLRVPQLLGLATALATLGIILAQVN